MAQRVGHRPSGRFAGRIGRQLTAVDPRRNRQHIEQRAATIGFEHGSEGLADVQYAKDVSLKDAACYGIAVLGQKSARLGNARVVDQQGHIRCALNSGCDLIRLSDIELQSFDTRQSNGDGIARGSVDLACATGEQSARKG